MDRVCMRLVMQGLLPREGSMMEINGTCNKLPGRIREIS